MKKSRQILNIGYSPRRQVFLLSGLYPYELIEAMGLSAGFLDGEIKDMPSAIDAMAMAAWLANGVLSSGMLSFQENDAIGLSAGLSDGTLKVVFVSSTLDKEAIGLSGGLSNGTLKVVLVTNTMQTEAIGLSAGFNNGTLS